MYYSILPSTPKRNTRTPNIKHHNDILHKRISHNIRTINPPIANPRHTRPITDIISNHHVLLIDRKLHASDLYRKRRRNSVARNAVAAYCAVETSRWGIKSGDGVGDGWWQVGECGAAVEKYLVGVCAGPVLGLGGAACGWCWDVAFYFLVAGEDESVGGYSIEFLALKVSEK